MSLHVWHLFGVALPYVLIATALWGLTAGAVKDAVRVGSIPGRTRVGRAHLPTVPLAYALGFAAVAFIYGCALDRRHMGLALGADPHAMAPGADAYLYVLAGASWLSAALLIGPYRWLRRRTRELLAAPVDRDRAEARYRLLAEHLTDLVCHHEPDGRYEWLSPSVETLLGYRPDELVGRDPYDLFHPDDAARIRTESHEQILDGRLANTLVRYRIRRKDGRYLWFESLTEPMRDEAGAIVRLQVTSRDITKRQAAEDDLLHRTHHDPLTGLVNRVLFTLRLDALVEARRAGDPAAAFAVLFLDLDRFKAINDVLGHHVGDALLVQFSTRLLDATRSLDTVARVGGDEFAVILHGVSTEAEAVEAASRIEAALQTPFDLVGTSRTLTASIGIAIGHAGHTSAGELLREADLAAYAAKAEGRSGWTLFAPALREASDRRLRLETDLEQAVERGELRIAYQPIVRLDTGALHGVEALVRWEHPDLGLLMPDTFIAIAEETGRIGDLDRWVMAEGLDQIDRWIQSTGYDRDLTLAVNCSACALHDPRFADRVNALLQVDPARARRLVIEITESLLVDDPQAAVAALQSLRAQGVRFAMDDFGTGYSSLSVVHALPLDTVKIDRAFVQRMHEDEAACQMVQTVIGFARTLGVDAVAEGIETPEQFAALVAMGCDYGQGHLFDRPLAPEAMAERLRAERLPWASRWETVPA